MALSGFGASSGSTPKTALARARSTLRSLGGAAGFALGAAACVTDSGAAVVASDRSSPPQPTCSAAMIDTTENTLNRIAFRFFRIFSDRPIPFPLAFVCAGTAILLTAHPLDSADHFRRSLRRAAPVRMCGPRRSGFNPATGILAAKVNGCARDRAGSRPGSKSGRRDHRHLRVPSALRRRSSKHRRRSPMRPPPSARDRA